MSRIQAEDLATVRPTGPANWSTDGRSLAYVQAERSGTNRLWLVSYDGGTPRMVADVSVVVEGTDGTDRRDVGGGPQWSPDGRSIAFLSSMSGRPPSVCVADVGSGNVRTLTAGADRTPRWSTDGRLAFVRHRDGRDDIFIVDAPGAPPVQLTYGHYDNNDIAWSPDGRWIAFSSQRSDEDVFSSNLCIVPAAGGAVIRLTQGDRANDRSPRWSPDGRTIVFVSNRDDSDDIWTIPSLGGDPTRVTSGRGDKGDPRWSPDGKRIAYTHALHANIDIAVITIGSERATALTDGGVNSAPRWSPDGTQLAFVHSSAAEPKNVWLMAPSGGGRQALTSSKVQSGQPINWSGPELVVLRPEEGVEIEALLYPAVPASGRPGPAVVFVHEGPNNIQTNGFEGLIQFLAQRGYTVIAPNYRGSTGYGRTFMEANAGDRVGADLRDWAAAARRLAELPTVDPKRIAILGHSAGGEATLLSLGLLPELFAAGVAMSAPSNRFTYWEDTDLAWARRLRYKLMGLPSAARDTYIQRSAVTHVAAYRAPVLIIQGEDDPGVPASQAREMAAALKAAGKSHECVIYPDEGHYFAGADAIIDTADRIERFLAKELGARGD